MLAEEARRLAADWAREYVGASPGSTGAFLHGSINEMRPEKTLPPTSDVDILVVADERDPSLRYGKFPYHGVLLEVSMVPAQRVASTERVLSDYTLTGSFRVPSVVVDRTGRLVPLQEAVARGFSERRWVEARRRGAEQNALGCIERVSDAEDLHDRVMSCAFGAGVMAHVLLVAGLRNPTVRRRYLAARALLDETGQAEIYEELLDLLGCRTWNRSRVEAHLSALEEAYDAASTVVRPDYRFAADLTPAARPVAIDGSRELIARGDHREAVFWMVAVASRCQWVFHHHAPAGLRDAHRDSYQRLIEDLGMGSVSELRQRAARLRAFLPRVRAAADVVMERTPGIRGR